MIGNLMHLAMGVTGSQRVEWSAFKKRYTNGVGHKVNTYAQTPTPIRGSVQPVPTRMYQVLGLDAEKRYVTLYTPAGVVGARRDGTGDRIAYKGLAYVAESSTDWQLQAGWAAVLCVEVPA